MISICIPYIRPDNIPALTDAIIKHAGIPAEDYEIITEYDADRIGCPKMLSRLVGKSKGNMVCFLGDDTIPGTDFLRHALEAMNKLPDGWGVVGLNSQKSRHAGHFLADKRMLDLLPNREFFNTEYVHCWCDHELTDIAYEHGRFIFADLALLQHYHPAFKTASTDSDYDRVYDPSVTRRDQLTYFRRKIERNGDKVAIGFPVIDSKVFLQFMVSFIMLDKPQNWTLLIPNFPVGEFPRDIAAVRNNLVEMSLMDGCRYLIMMDTDQIYRDPATITKLLGHKKDVVSCPVHRRYPPFDPILMRGKIGALQPVPDAEAYSGDLIPIDATGTGCVCFDTKVFLEISRPWFMYQPDFNGKPVGEDLWFFHRLQQAGFKSFCDTSISVGHMSLFEVNRSTYELFNLLSHKKGV